MQSMAPPGCPACGVVSTRVHARREQALRDVPVGGLVQVVWAKRQWRCTDDGCARATWVLGLGIVLSLQGLFSPPFISNSCTGWYITPC